MKTNLTILALGAAALSLTALVAVAPASAQTKHHRAAAQQTFQTEDYGSVTGSVRGQHVQTSEATKADPDANIRFELRRDSNLDQE
jgi:hypothetical protein